MAAKTKDKKEKGKKNKHKTDRVSEETAAMVENLSSTSSPGRTPSLEQTRADKKTSKEATASTPPAATGAADAILDAVGIALAQEGTDGLTTRRIATRAGVNEVTLFRRFGGKQQLLEEFFLRAAGRLNALDVPHGADLAADLIIVVKGCAILLSDTQAGVTVLFAPAAILAEERKPALKTLTYFDRVKARLRMAMDEGKLQRQNASMAMIELLGPVVLHASAVLPDSERKATFNAGELVRTFLHGREPTRPG